MGLEREAERELEAVDRLGFGRPMDLCAVTHEEVAREHGEAGERQ